MDTDDQGDGTPIRVAVVNDYEIVVAGVAAVLAPHRDRVRIIELAAGVPAVSDVDVVLYDTYAAQRNHGVRVADLVSADTRLVVYSWEDDAALVAASVAAGASGFVSKASSAGELVDVIERVHAGEEVLPPDLTVADGGVVPADPDHGAGAGADEVQYLGRWPGDDHGLSARESEVLALICRGLSNEEITAEAFIGINTVKTHIRMLYRKIGVSRRTQAVLWGHRHGFEPDRARAVRA